MSQQNSLQERIDSFRLAYDQLDLQRAIVRGLKYRDNVAPEEITWYEQGLARVEGELLAEGIQLGLIRLQ